MEEPIHTQTHRGGNRPSPRFDQIEIRWLCLGLITVSIFVWGMLWPKGAHWGFHALAYFPLGVRMVTVVGVCLLLVLSAAGRVTFFRLTWLWSGSRRFSPWGEILIGFIAFLIFYGFPMQGLIYGDSNNMLQWYKNNSQFDTRWITQLFALNPFSSKEALTVLLHRSTAHLFSLSIEQSYRILSALFGGMFVTLLLLFVRSRRVEARSSLTLILAGMFCGANAIFFGEVENYAFANLSWGLFLAGAALYFDRRLKWYWVVLLFFLAVKGHAAGMTFLPAMIFLLCYQFQDAWRWAHWLARPAGLLLGVVLPFLIAGLVFYILLGAYKEPYAGPPDRQIQRSFLPVLPASPPLHRYTLQSANHLYDLLNVAALVTVPVSILLLGCVLWHRRQFQWSDPRILFFLVAVLFCGSFYFAVNPVLAMPRDWNLYTPLTVPLLFLLAALLPRQVPRTALALSAGVGAFSIFFFALNANAERLSYRIEDAGRYAYRTYNAGCGFFTRRGIGLDPDPARRVARLRENYRHSRSMAFPGDQQFADEAWSIASIEKHLGREAAAESLLKEAVKICPSHHGPHAMLADMAMLRGRIPEATREVETLLELNRMWVGAQFRAVQLALLTGDREGAVDHLAVLDSLAAEHAMTRRLREEVQRRWPE